MSAEGPRRWIVQLTYHARRERLGPYDERTARDVAAKYVPDAENPNGLRFVEVIQLEDWEV